MNLVILVWGVCCAFAAIAVAALSDAVSAEAFIIQSIATGFKLAFIVFAFIAAVILCVVAVRAIEKGLTIAGNKLTALMNNKKENNQW